MHTLRELRFLDTKNISDAYTNAESQTRYYPILKDTELA